MAALVAAVPGSAKAAETWVPEAALQTKIDAPLDQVVAFKATGPVRKVIATQPDLVEVGLAGPRDLYVIGRNLGATNLLVYDAEGRLAQTIDVRVGHDMEGVRASLREALPDEAVAVVPVGSGIMLEGAVSTPAASELALRLAERAAPGAVISRLSVKTPAVRIDVQIIEASERRLADLSAALRVSDGHVTVAGNPSSSSLTPPHLTAVLDTNIGRQRLQGILRGLEEKGDFRIVAEPSLVAAHLEAARFRAGGELPIPIPADDGVAVEFHPYGAALNIRPELRGNGTIRLAFEAELSEPDPFNKLSIGGVDVPALTVRRVSTTADLRQGETLLVAGLLEMEQRRSVQEAPGLARLPIVGSAFRSLSAKTARRELAILVTPHLATPTDIRTAAATAAPSAENVSAVAGDSTKRSAPARARASPWKTLYREARAFLSPPVRWASRQVKGLFGRA